MMPATVSPLTTTASMTSVKRNGWPTILTTTNSAISTSPAGIAAARQLEEISSVGVMTMASSLTCSIAAGSSMTMNASVTASVNGSAYARSVAGRRLTTVFIRRFSLRRIASAAPSMPSHRKIVEASSGPRLLSLHDSVKPQAERYIRMYISLLTGDIRPSVAEHDAIIDAIEAGNADEAQVAVQTNWRHAADRIVKVIDVAGERGSW